MQVKGEDLKVPKKGEILQGYKNFINLGSINYDRGIDKCLYIRRRRNARGKRPIRYSDESNL